MSQLVLRGMVEHELGVHLNQRHDDYILDPGIGYGAVKDIFLSPMEWWNASFWNPLRDTTDDDERRKAFARGTALHTYVLDGPKVYGATYATYPTKNTHPDALDTVEQLVEACQRLGLSTRGKKDDLVHTLVGPPIRRRGKVIYEPKAEVLAHLQAQHRDSGKLPVSETDHIRIQLLHRMMMRTTEELQLGDGDHLTIKQLLDKALTEVSVFWVDENGIRQRARFDALKPNVTADLKSITQWKKSNFDKALLTEIILRGYMIQAVHYNEGRKALRQAVAEGRVFGGNKTQRKLLDRIARSDYWAWVNIFAKMDGAPQVKGIVIRPESGQFIKAEAQREEALAKFVWHRDFHGGMEKPWFDPNVIWEPTELEWPMFSVLGQ